MQVPFDGLPAGFEAGISEGIAEGGMGEPWGCGAVDGVKTERTLEPLGVSNELSEIGP